MSDTPRTDELLTAMLDVYGYVHNGNCPQRWVNHARELERELNAANESFRKLNIHALELTDHIRRLKNAGDAMEKLLPEGSIYDKAAIRWIKTKNDKL